MIAHFPQLIEQLHQICTNCTSPCNDRDPLNDEKDPYLLEAQNTADNLLALVDNDKLDEAKTEVKQLAKEFREQRKALSEGMMKLWKLQADFTALSGVV